MKANESVKNYPSKLRLYTNYTVRDIRNICKTIGPRPSASESERKAQEHFAEQMNTCCDKVETEEFKVHPAAFMGWVIIDVVAMMLSLITYFFGLPVVSLVLSAFTIICMFAEFLMYWEFLDPFFPKKTSCNVIGRRSPTGEVKQRIIFSGHVDSAYEWQFTYRGGAKFLAGMIAYAIVGMVYCTIVDIITLAAYGPLYGLDGGADKILFITILGFAQFVFLPGFIAVMFFVDWGRPVEGANDNLTGSVASIAVLKFLQDNDIHFENTEVVAMTAGCEEAGLRGSRAYVKRHLKELQDVPTVFFGMDTLTDYEYMAIYNRDMTGTVKNDQRVCNLMKKASQTAGLDLPFKSVFFGASDAAAVSKLGVPAATIAAMDPAPARYYHTRLDTPEKLNMKTVEAGLNVCLETLFLFDEQGLKENYD